MPPARSALKAAVVDTQPAMSEESTAPDRVEITRGMFESIDHDWDFEAVAGFFAPDAVLDMGPLGLGVHKGLAATRAVLEDWWATWEDHHHYVEEAVDLGHGELFVAVCEDGRAKGSDAVVEARIYRVYEWADRVIVRWTPYPDIAEARAAAERLAEERG